MIGVTVILVLFISIIYAISQDMIVNVKIPDEEYGEVISKSLFNNGWPARYAITIKQPAPKTLYIQNNTTLYESIQLNQKYLFECRIDYNNKLIIVDKATQPPER
jgi:hypothetical protein